MSAAGSRGGRERRLTVDSDRLLLVEGRDEVNLFNALIKNAFDGEAAIQVIDAGGKDRFSARFRAIREAVKTRPTFRCLGIVRDADDDAKGAFASVCHQVRAVGYEPPPSPGDFAVGPPSIGVFIMPDGRKPGALETLCRQSVAGSPAAQCVEAYLRCLEQRKVPASRNRDKRFAHAYLAAARDPVARVGEGAQQGVWDFTSPAFGDLAGFLRKLAG